MAASRKLNPKEERVLTVLESAPRATGMSIEELAKTCFPEEGTSSRSRGNSWVRNSLRKLVRLHYVARRQTGIYVFVSQPEAVAAVTVTTPPATKASRKKRVKTRDSAGRVGPEAPESPIAAAPRPSPTAAKARQNPQPDTPAAEPVWSQRQRIARGLTIPAVPEALAAALQAHARRRRVSVSAAVVELLQAQLTKDN